MKRLCLLIILCLLLTGCSKALPQSPEPTLPVLEGGSVSVSLPATPSLPPLVTEEPEPAVTGEPVLEPTQPPAPYYPREGVDTLAWISDTQHYANIDENGLADIYPTITAFLRDEREPLHLRYVVHTGDLVHRNYKEDNWDRAVAAMALLEDIPLGVLAGNHDMNGKTGYSAYRKHFGAARFEGYPCYGESFEDNRGHYDLVTLSGREYIFVYMSYALDDKALDFIYDSFHKYPQRVGVLCLHAFLDGEGQPGSGSGQVEKRILGQCPNVYLVLCGHNYGLRQWSKVYTDSDGEERRVYALLQNYQSAGKEGGSGYFSLVQFDEQAGCLRFTAYSAYLDDINWLDGPGAQEPRYEMDADSESFTLPMPWLE